MLNLEQKEHFSEWLEALGETMDIPLSQYDTIVTSYKAVGEQLYPTVRFVASEVLFLFFVSLLA
jgi:hypothetical protein